MRQQKIKAQVEKIMRNETTKDKSSNKKNYEIIPIPASPPIPWYESISPHLYKPLYS